MTTKIRNKKLIFWRVFVEWFYIISFNSHITPRSYPYFTEDENEKTESLPMKFSSLLYLWAYSMHTAQGVERPSFRCQRTKFRDSSTIRNLEEHKKQQNHKEDEPQNKLCPNPCVRTALHKHRENPQGTRQKKEQLEAKKTEQRH